MTRHHAPHKRLSIMLLVVLSLLFSVAAVSAGSSDDAPEAKRAQHKVKRAEAASKTRQKKKAQKKKGSSSEPIAPEREAAVLAFVKRHHTDLTDLLAYLKEQHPREYGRAVRQLYPISERLSKMKEVDSERYELALKTWKAMSRVQLLAAQAKMTGSTASREELEQALHEQINLKTALLARDRDKFRARADKLDAQRKQLEEQRERSVARQMKLLLRTSKSTAKKTASKKTAAKKTSSKRAEP